MHYGTFNDVNMKQPSGNVNLVSLSVRVEQDVADRFKVIADANDRPVAAHLRRLIKEHVGLIPEDKAVA